MASIAENLRATLLSLKQISDRVKSLILTSVTKSELNSAKQEVLTAVEDIDIDLTPVEEKVDEVSDKIDDIKDTFDADMALQLQGIIGEGEESVDSNSQTEGEIERLRTLQESYNALAGNSSAIALETEVEAGKAAIVDAIEDKGGTASTAMSLTGLAQAIDSIQVPTLLRLNSIVFENGANNKVIDMGGIGVLNAATFNFSNYGSIEEVRNFPQMPLLTSLASLFRSCVSLKHFVFGSRIDTSNVAHVDYMFQTCYSIEEIDVSSLDSSSVSSCDGMFTACSNLKRINARGFNFGGIIRNLLYQCPKLEWIDFRETTAYTANNVADTFPANCPSLTTMVGGISYQEVVDGNVKIMEGLNSPAGGTNFSDTPNIDQASLRALINGLADRTGQSALTLRLVGQISKLSAEDIAVATNKNWNLTN